MSVTKQVTVSGSVGKQVFAITGQPAILDGVIVDAVSAGTIAIRDGASSGNLVLTASFLKQESAVYPIGGMKFNKGMHVKVIGNSNKAYLVIR